MQVLGLPRSPSPILLATAEAPLVCRLAQQQMTEKEDLTRQLRKVLKTDCALHDEVVD